MGNTMQDDMILHNFSLLIVAAGKGTRFGSDIPKQFTPFLHHAYMIDYIIAKAQHYCIEKIYVVTHHDYERYWPTKHDHITIVKGGDTRQQSVYHGLQKIKQDGLCDHVIIHDAVRPYMDKQVLIDMATKVTATHIAAAPYLPIYDALKNKNHHQKQQRDSFAIVQTPQIFRLDAIVKAHQHMQTCPDIVCDDDIDVLISTQNASIYQGKGSRKNIKITTKEDKELMEQILQEEKIFISASGIDIHKFCEGSFITLGGVKIAHSKALEGHSDADVIYHALCDSLFGLACEGDIGVHFSPKDSRWKNADSSMFVTYARDICAKKNIIITLVDVTFIAEQPKISRYQAMIKENISHLLQISTHDINIKGTTTEKLGFLGNKEGVAAMVQVSAYRYKGKMTI